MKQVIDLDAVAGGREPTQEEVLAAFKSFCGELMIACEIEILRSTVAFYRMGGPAFWISEQR